MTEEGGKETRAAEAKPLKVEKPDVSRLLAFIPPASVLKQRQKRITEKRIRIKYDDSLEREQAKINPNLAKELGIEDLIELSVAGRHRFVLKVIIDDEVEENRVHVNPDLMQENGVADNSIATVRPYKGSERLGVNLGPRK